MKWTFNQLGLVPPLTWTEWFIMLVVFVLLIVAGWAVIKCFEILFDVRGE